MALAGLPRIEISELSRLIFYCTILPGDPRRGSYDQDKSMSEAFLHGMSQLTPL